MADFPISRNLVVAKVQVACDPMTDAGS
jgi:hypothetical protein